MNTFSIEKFGPFSEKLYLLNLILSQYLVFYAFLHLCFINKNILKSLLTLAKEKYMHVLK